VLALRLAALLALLFLNGFIPGYVAVRKLRVRPLEKLCAAVGVSLILIYLGTLALYLSPLRMVSCGVGSLAALALGFVHRAELAGFAAIGSVRRVVRGFLLLLAWTLAFVGLVRHFGGGGWGIDWLEHFHRSLYFLDRLPADVMLAGKAHVTARPPFMNVVAAYFLAQAGDDFECFELVFAFLSTLPFLACALIAGRLWPGGGRGRRVLVPLLAFCPLFVASATYTWTKLLCAFFVIVAVHFYLGAVTERDRGARSVAWPLALAASLLVHYSAGVFALFLTGHHLARVIRERPPRLWRRALAPALPGVVLLGTWMLLALARFGAGRTLTSNTAVGDSQDFSAAGNALKVVLNIVDTIVPHPLRAVPLGQYARGGTLGYWRDYFFLIYQTNAVVAVGSVGGLIALGLLWQRFRRAPIGFETAFWRALIPFVVIAGVATHGGRDRFGVAHVTLQPQVLLAVTLLAAAWPRLPRIARAAALLGCLVDFGLGIALHHHLLSLENTPARQVFDPDIRVADGTFEWRREGQVPASDWQGWYAKQARPLLDAQIERAHHLPRDRARHVLEAVTPERERQDLLDASDWAGFWRRHGGRLTFIGDHLARGAIVLWGVIATMLLGFVQRLRARP
jgi:hypothetical protein